MRPVSRVSELIHLKIQDVNLMMGYITCRDEKEADRSVRQMAKRALGSITECARSLSAWTG